MTKQEAFLEFWDHLIHDVAGDIEIPEDVKMYIEALRENHPTEKPAFTANGKAILQYLQSNIRQMYRSKEIADEMAISSRTVAGAMRKLVTDGYVEKIGKDPTLYIITDKGLEIKFEENINA